MSAPDWELKYLEPGYLNKPFQELLELCEKEMIRACMIPDHLFTGSSSYEMAKTHQEMTEKRIEEFLTALSIAI